MKRYNIKQIRIFILLLCVFAIHIQLNAKEVKFEIVKKIAINAYALNTGKTHTEIIEVIPISVDNKNVYYIFNFENGYIIVAGDDVATPILAYGLGSNIDLNKVPPNLLFLLNNYKNNIHLAQEQNIHQSKKNIENWNYYIGLNEQKATRYYSSGTYLLQTTWGQSNGYQKYCPIDPKTGIRSIVGCGGVALGQILKYWSCKVFPDNSITYTPDGFQNSITVNYYDQNYQWQNMNLTSSDNENALLLYHSAVSLRSNFGSSATSSNPYQVPYALVTYFGFNASLESKKNYNNYTWINMLRNDIDLGYPIFYVGYNISENTGHAWVIDGYKTDNTFHCNWGWEGNYNGWFLLNNITPGGHTYNDNQLAMLNTYPILDACSGLSGSSLFCTSSHSYSVSIPSSASVTWSKSSNLTQIGGNTNTTFTVKATNSNQSESGFIRATIKNSQGNIFLVRTKNVWIGKPKFTVEGDEQLEIRMPGIAMIDYSNGGGGSTNVTWTRSGAIASVNGGPVTAKFRAGSRPGMGAVYATISNGCGSKENRLLVQVTDGWYSIYPNPANNEIYINLDNSKMPENITSQNFTIKLYDKMMILKKQKSFASENTTLNVSDLKEGVYILQIISGNQTFEEKIMINR